MILPSQIFQHVTGIPPLYSYSIMNIIGFVFFTVPPLPNQILVTQKAINKGYEVNN